MNLSTRVALATALALSPAMITPEAAAAEDATASAASVHPLWADIPAWNSPSEPERDTSGPDGRLVADRPVVRLGNVRNPEVHLFPAAPDAAVGTTVIVCPGGGYSILAWDLEGTEIARWLQGLGIDAAVLKYRVPTRAEPERWLAPVQDIQRAVRLARGGDWLRPQPERVGLLGFSAGGNAAVRAATADRDHYQPQDAYDRLDARPDFAVLVYPAWLVREDEPTKLVEGVQVGPETPPMFFAHARDDRVSCSSSVTMFQELHRQGIPAALHLFSGGGHGFGARPTGGEPDAWPALCEAWMKQRGWLPK